MQWNDVATNWTSHVPRVLTRWPDLSEDEVLAVDGDRAALARLVADGESVRLRDAELEISEWLEGAEPADAVMDESRDNARIDASARDIAPGEEPLDDDGAFGDDDKATNPIGRD